MDALSIKYDYEPYSFLLDEGIGYCPDFWLPNYDSFLEIKPAGALAEREMEKALLWVEFNGDLVILEGFPIRKGHSLIGTNTRPVFTRDSIRWGECPRCRTIVLSDNGEPNCNCFDLEELEDMFSGASPEVDFTKTTRLKEAYRIARKHSFTTRNRVLPLQTLMDFC